MIALPFVSDPPGPLDFRLLLNQFDETLSFSLVDKGVPNRGVDDAHAVQTDQVITALDYEQLISQVAVTDRPASTVAGAPEPPSTTSPDCSSTCSTRPTAARPSHGSRPSRTATPLWRSAPASRVDGPPR